MGDFIKILVLSSLIAACSSMSPPAQSVSPSAKLIEIAHEAKMPGFGLQLYENGMQKYTINHGYRKAGLKINTIGRYDQWHLGSCGKAFTANLIFQAIHEERIDWSTPLKSFFPDLAQENAVLTIEDLLTQESGLSELDNAKEPVYQNRVKARAEISHRLLKIPKNEKEYGNFHYLNSNYVILGSILETIYKSDYEKIVKERVWTALGMKTCGFGLPGTGPNPDVAPIGHIINHEGQIAISSAAADQFSLIMTPVGLMHCSLDDWAKFLTYLGLEYKNKNQDSDHVHYFSKKNGGMYLRAAFAEFDRFNGKRGPFFVHSGTNGSFNAFVIWSPDEGRFAIAATNLADEIPGDKTVSTHLKDMIEEAWESVFKD